MNHQPKYSLAEFWEDLRSMNLARPAFVQNLSFDENVKNHFESIHGKSEYVTWRYGRFMLVNIYINANKKAFDVGNLAVAGPHKNSDNLISDLLAGRVLKYAVENPIVGVWEFPHPDYFIKDSDLPPNKESP